MPEVGKIYSLKDPDYKYGAGPLLARVTKIVREALFDNETWWEVEAMVKPPDAYGPGQERLLYLREPALTPLQGKEKPAPPGTAEQA